MSTHWILTNAPAPARAMPVPMRTRSNADELDCTHVEASARSGVATRNESVR